MKLTCANLPAINNIAYRDARFKIGDTEWRGHITSIEVIEDGLIELRFEKIAVLRQGTWRLSGITTHSVKASRFMYRENNVYIVPSESTTAVNTLEILPPGKHLDFQREVKPRH